MQFKHYAPLLFILAALQSFAQTNILVTAPVAEQIMKGNYNPSNYSATYVISHPDSIAKHLQQDISPDSLKNFMLALNTFHNRNSGSDTVSNTKGIGAARRWTYSKFQQFSAANGNRLIPFYLQFNLNICNSLQHRNICAVLPGSDTSDKSIILIEGHIDSRCEDLCDTACLADGMEDNASGTALVMELARVMSQFTLKRTVVFMLTIAEEQGLLGAEAMADYVQQKNIKLHAVLNNDVVGGIICGQTSSEPSCPGFNDIDSTHLRIFSDGVFNSKNKQLARFTKLQYKEEILPIATVPMDILIMTPEDRTGRGGDHIPFGQKGYAAIRFTSANEHGDANVDSVNYADRQHSTRDILGVDTDNDQVIDSFYVDFNYLSRNTVINGMSASMAAIGPVTPVFIADTVAGNRIYVEIQNEVLFFQYRVAIRSLTNDWDSVYTLLGTNADTIELCNPGIYYVSVATMDYNNTESLFSNEKMLQLNSTSNCMTSVADMTISSGLQLLQNKPNPFDEITAISIWVNEQVAARQASISITDALGKEVKQLSFTLKPGMNEVLYEHGYGAKGVYFYTLFIEGKAIQTRRMVFN